MHFSVILEEDPISIRAYFPISEAIAIIHGSMAKHLPQPQPSEHITKIIEAFQFNMLLLFVVISKLK